MVRVGIGYDVHRLEAGRPLIIGGVTIPHESGMLGHSDADVLAHSVADALLGAAAMGDIGVHFPDDEEKYRGADSLELVRAVVEMLRGSGFQVNNVDATVAIQRPRLRPYVDEMRERLSAALGIERHAVSVKATTTERLGFVGAEEGVAAYAVCAVSTEE